MRYLISKNKNTAVIADILRNADIEANPSKVQIGKDWCKRVGAMNNVGKFTPLPPGVVFGWKWRCGPTARSETAPAQPELALPAPTQPTLAQPVQSHHTPPLLSFTTRSTEDTISTSTQPQDATSTQVTLPYRSNHTPPHHSTSTTLFPHIHCPCNALTLGYLALPHCVQYPVATALSQIARRM